MTHYPKFYPTDTLPKLRKAAKDNRCFTELSEDEKQKLIMLNLNLKALEADIENEVQTLYRYGLKRVEDPNSWIYTRKSMSVTINFCLNEDNEVLEEDDDPIVIEMEIPIGDENKSASIFEKEDASISEMPDFIETPCWSFQIFYNHSGMHLGEMLYVDSVEAWYELTLGSKVENVLK